MKQHSPGFLKIVEQAKSQINEITPLQLQSWFEQGKTFYCIDVRDAEELVLGKIPGAIHLSKGIIERDIEKIIPDMSACVVVYCSGGYRCALTALNLQKMGYTSVYSLSTGLSGWTEQGLPVES